MADTNRSRGRQGDKELSRKARRKRRLGSITFVQLLILIFLLAGGLGIGAALVLAGGRDFPDKPELKPRECLTILAFLGSGYLAFRSTVHRPRWSVNGPENWRWLLELSVFAITSGLVVESFLIPFIH